MTEALAAQLRPVTPLRAVRDGFVVGVANPKTIVFFIVALPEFTSRAPGHLPVQAQMLILGALFPVIALVLDSACRATIAGAAGQMVRIVAAAAGADRRRRRPGDDRTRRQRRSDRPQGLAAFGPDTHPVRIAHIQQSWKITKSFLTKNPSGGPSVAKQRRERRSGDRWGSRHPSRRGRPRPCPDRSPASPARLTPKPGGSVGRTPCSALNSLSSHPPYVQLMLSGVAFARGDAHADQPPKGSSCPVRMRSVRQIRSRLGPLDAACPGVRCCRGPDRRRRRYRRHRPRCGRQPGPGRHQPSVGTGGVARPRRGQDARRADHGARTRCRIGGHRGVLRDQPDPRARQGPGRPDRPGRRLTPLPAAIRCHLPIRASFGLVSTQFEPVSSQFRASEVSNVIASRGAGDLEGSGGRQHRRVRVRQPGSARHRHADRQLHPAAGTGGRPELLRVRRRRPVRDQHRQRRGRPGGHHLPVRFTTEVARPGHVPLQHRTDRVAEQPELEPPPDLHGHRASGGSDEASPPGLACPPCNIGPLSTPDYAALADEAVHNLGTGSRCSPGSGPRASTSTWARSSTWPTCGRSRTCTPSGTCQGTPA